MAYLTNNELSIRSRTRTDDWRKEMETPLDSQQQCPSEDTESPRINRLSTDTSASKRTPYQGLAEWKLVQEAKMKGCLVASPSELTACLTASEIANLP